MLFCRLMPTVFLLSATMLVSPALAAVPEPARVLHHKTGPAAQAGHGYVDSEAYLRGIVAVRLGDDLEAAQAFRKALQADPADADLLRQAFVRSVMVGAPQAVELARVVDKTPQDRSVISALVLGDDAAMRGAWPEAVQYYHRAGADPMARLIVPLLLAWCQQAQGHADEAIENLLHVPGSGLMPFYTLHAALIAQVAGQSDRAGTLFVQAQKAMPGYDMLLTRSHAAWLWNHGQQDKARAVIRKLVATDSILGLAGPALQAEIAHYPVTSAREGIARAYVLTAFLLRQQAREQAQQGMEGEGSALNLFQFNEAARLMLGFALAMDPTLADARLMLAEIQDDEHHFAAARETLVRVPPQDPLAMVATLRLAVLETTNDHPAEAIPLLQHLAQQVPGQIIIERSLGNAFSQTKDWKAAIAAYTRAIDLANVQKSPDWTLLFLRGMAYHEAGDWAAAKNDTRAALAYAPDEPLLLNFLGYGMVEQHEDLAEAEQLLRKAHALDDQDAAITDSLGWVRVEQGDLAGGIPLLEKAAEQTPEDPEVNYHLGEAYWRIGRKTEAVDQWNVALGLHPSPADESLIRAALQKAGVPPTPPAGAGSPAAQPVPAAQPAPAQPVQEQGKHTP
ncbi:MAG: tetratricopeptide repeat protein [Acetobacter fabarum]|uniref:tetratricopeptide repeat protein n=1 Tax=Acetobacter fabarum TaxID=483199 RepID=UPI00390A0B1E|nr:tetratricopeptide repeat protein [Acetobacter fabarum]MCI1910207.1 tetratricopeptide repeat protein [Acetobacter fabarum]MCI1928705.1 tetratricopeptide repeat protein [Acetobacter fabarum]MCI1947556.1 tetratricopeptide repeat protein [Acetobacter fabarum]MCI1988818.1 tetratricopeptide repeat protein [Acetobacter fabarum]